MKDIYVKDENILYHQLIGEGSFGSVYKVFKNEEEMALKKLKDDMEIPDAVFLKIIEMCKDCEKFDKNLIVPKYVVDDKFKDKYLMNCVEGKGLNKYLTLPLEEKIEILRKAKELVCAMNNCGIIHGDLYFANFIYNGDAKNVYIIDFDSSSYGGYDLEVDLANDLTGSYIYHNGIGVGVDKFMFNIMTFAFLNNITTYKARINMLREEYGVFDYCDAKKICDSVANFYKCNDFLIDTLDDEKVKKKIMVEN